MLVRYLSLAILLTSFSAKSQPPPIVWQNAGNMSITRFFHSTTLLDSGRVLAAGGTPSSPFSALSTAELYNPATNTWSLTDSMNTPRQYHRALRLPNGEVLVSGGYDGGILSSCELYDPNTASWSSTGSMTTSRTGHRTILLNNGKVLAVGGRDGGLAWLNSCELYDTASGTWTTTQSMTYQRFDPEIVELNDGRILVTGGGSQQTCEIYDPATGTWSPTASMNVSRRYHSITRLADGRVLVTGGMQGVSSGATANAEIFNPTTGTWSDVPNLSGIRWLHEGVLLPNGKVLVVGGATAFDYLPSRVSICQVFNPTTSTWEPFPNLQTTRCTHGSILLANEQVLVVGGSNQLFNEITAPPVPPPPPTPEPRLISVRDVPFDQGRKVRVNWLRSSLDSNVNELTHYSIWRATPGPGPDMIGKRNGLEIASNPRRIRTISGMPFNWEWIADQPAHRFQSYSYTASTLYDSSASTHGKHYFLVSAHTPDPNVFYDSNIDSGYSVDNIPPAGVPSLAAVGIGGNLVDLHWQSSTGNPDLHCYVIYRSSVGGFVPNDANRIGTSVDTFYVDSTLPSSGPVYYRVSARDFQGNEGSPSPEASAFVTNGNGGDGTPLTFALGQNYPNPFNPTTTIDFTLPVTSFVSLTITDVLGETLEYLVGENLSAGSHVVSWNASRYPSGVYFYRLQAGGFSETKKLILSK